MNSTKTSELSARKKKGKNLGWFVAVGLLCASQVVTLYLLCRSNQKVESLVVAYDDNPRIRYLVQRHNLLQAIEKYDQVIYAIKRYEVDHGAYPPDLQALVPRYLSRLPGIYITKKGEGIGYAPIPRLGDVADFTFFAYGHHTGLQSWYGWEFKYCPIELGDCADADGYPSARINDQWVWDDKGVSLSDNFGNPFP